MAGFRQSDRLYTEASTSGFSMKGPLMTRLLPIAALLMLMPMLAAAHEYRAGTLLIEHPWARATPKGAEVGGGYMKVVNEGKQADRLIGASLALAQKTEIHAMKMENGVMQMRPATQGLEIKP